LIILAADICGKTTDPLVAFLEGFQEVVLKT